MKTNFNLVTKEIANNLKRIGFDYECNNYIENDVVCIGNCENHNLEDAKTSMPYAHIVLQFFREVYDIDVFVVKVSNITIYKIGYNFTIYVPEYADTIYGDVTYETYEEAEIGAIEFILKEMTDYGE